MRGGAGLCGVVTIFLEENGYLGRIKGVVLEDEPEDVNRPRVSGLYDIDRYDFVIVYVFIL